ncbi:MAG: hypothetical protein ACRD2J_07185 [Thermoanaerobaculia bacterium]
MSTERRLPFAAAPDAAPELVLAARALAAPLRDRGIEAVELPDAWNRGGEPPILVLGERTEPGLMRGVLQLVLVENHLDLLRGDERIDSFAPFGPPLPPPRDPRRLLVRGGSSSRRTRMIERTLALLEPFGIRSLCWRECPDLERPRRVDEVHTDVDAEELTRLLSSAGVAFEPAEGPEDSTVLPPLAASCGITTVVHGAATGAVGVVAVEAWSPDSFAEAILGAIERGRVPAAGDAARAADRLVEAMGP